MWIVYICLMTNYLKADGFDEAMIGIDAIAQRIIYSKQKMIEIVSRQMDVDVAIELLEFNTWSFDVGEHGPIYCDEITMLEFEERLEDQI